MQQQFQNWPPWPEMNQKKLELPNAVAALVLGIASIFLGGVLSVICFLTSMGPITLIVLFLGLVCGIIAIALSGAPMRLYRQNPMAYTEASCSQLKAGRTCGIVGLSLSGGLLLVFVVGVLFLIVIFGGFGHGWG